MVKRKTISKEIFNKGSWGYGLLDGLYGVGALISTVLVGLMIEKTSRKNVLIICYTIAGLMCFIVPFLPTIYLAAIAFFFMGLNNCIPLGFTYPKMSSSTVSPPPSLLKQSSFFCVDTSLFNLFPIPTNYQRRSDSATQYRLLPIRPDAEILIPTTRGTATDVEYAVVQFF
mgnify:CR=1 FL=1